MLKWILAAVMLVVAGVGSEAEEATGTTPPAEGTVAAESPPFDLDGTWRGRIEGFKGPGLAEARVWDHELRMKITGDTAEVAFLWEGEWRNHGTLEVAPHGTNAVLFLTRSGRDDHCDWVETWSFTVMQDTEDSLRVFWYRLVNNWQCHGDDHGKFAFAASGRLNRVREGQADLPR